MELALTIRPELDAQSTIEITLDPNFTVKENQLKCEDLFKSKRYDCSMRGSVLEVSYDKTQGSSFLSFSAIGLRFGPIVNPTLPIESAMSITILRMDGESR